MIDGQSRSSPSATVPLLDRDTVSVTPDVMPAPSPGDPDLWRRRIRHDIRHELGTIIMLASAVAVSHDVGDTSRRRVEALLGETRWLHTLLRRLDEGAGELTPPPSPERVRVDDFVREIVEGVRL